LALREDEAKLQKARRRERGIIYVFSAGVVAAMGVFLALMLYARDRHLMNGWDYTIAVSGAAAALLTGGAVYVAHRGQTRREQRFGESLRDQLKRSIAQLDDEALSARRTSVLVTVTMGGICPTAILLLGWRINGKSTSDDGYLLVTLIVVGFWSVGSAVWELRRSVQRDILPRKRRLEALLTELDCE
jgi:hypothetical protein